MRIGFVLAPVALLANGAGARTPQEPTLPPPVAEPATLPGEHLGFETLDQRMTVPVEIAGAGPYRFIVDTGAQRTVISRQLAGTLGLPAGRNVRLTAMSGTSEVGTVMIPKLSVSTLGAERIEAPALDAQHLGAAGLVGIDSLQGHALAIDFDTQTMAVVPSKSRRSDRSIATAGDQEIVIRAKSLFGQLIVTNAYVGNTRIRVILDTGTPVSVANSALRKRLIRGSALKPLVMMSVLGGIVEANYAIAPTIKLGDATIESLAVAFADAPPFRAFGVEDKPALLLGMDALKLFRRVHIDFANRELRLAIPRDRIRRNFAGL